jgi:hypothetical protein
MVRYMGEDDLRQLAQKHALEALQTTVDVMRSGSIAAQKKAAKVLRNRAEWSGGSCQTTLLPSSKTLSEFSAAGSRAR